MTVLRNTAEGGTVGVAPTVGNSGGTSGDAFTVVTASGTSTVTVDNAHVKHGVKAYKILTGGTAENALVGLALSPNATAGAAQCYLYLTAYPTTQTRLMQFTTGAGSGKDAVSITAAGKLRWDSFAGTDVSTTLSVPLNAWFRVSIVGNTTSSAVYLFTDVESTTPAESLTGLSALSGDTFAYIRFGWTSSSVGFTAWYDTIETNGAAVLPDPYETTQAKSGSDTASGTDTGTLGASLVATELGQGAEDVSALSASLVATELGQGAEVTAALSASLVAADLGQGAEAVTASAALLASDSAACAEAHDHTAAVLSAETVASIENAARSLPRTWQRLDADSSATESGIEATSSAHTTIEG